jgi:predicted permease
MAHKLVLMQLGAALLLLLAAANLGNLGLVRMLGRRHEMAMRLALGARRLSLLRLVWLEALPLGLIAAGLGLALARVGAVALNAYGIAAAGTPFTIAFTPRVVLVIIGLALLATLIALSAPLLLISSRKLLGPLMEGSAQAGGISKGAQQARFGLSALQIALAVILLSEATLLGLSLQHMLKPNPGFKSRNLVVAKLTLNGKAYKDATRRKAAWQSLHKAVAALPGIQSAGISVGTPFNWGFRENFYRHHKDNGQTATKKQIVADGIAGDASVLPTLGVQLLAGRLLTQADVVSNAHVAVVDRHFAEALFGTADVVGKKTNGQRIVGVIAGIDDHFADPSQGTIALPASALKWGSALSVVVRSALPPATVARELRGALQHTLPNQSFNQIAPMRQYMGEYAQGTSALATMLIAFGFIAFVLAGVGTYGVIAQAARVRRREFAIRLALGARAGQIVGLVLRQGALLWLVGALVGVGLAFAAAQLIRSQLYGIGIWQPLAYLVPVLLLGALVMAASWLPARATLRLDPADALQSE